MREALRVALRKSHYKPQVSSMCHDISSSFRAGDSRSPKGGHILADKERGDEEETTGDQEDKIDVNNMLFEIYV